METIKIDILNPKAKALLEDLVNLNLIRIRKDDSIIDLKDLLTKLRRKSDSAPNLDEITKEVESVRASRYGQ